MDEIKISADDQAHESNLEIKNMHDKMDQMNKKVNDVQRDVQNFKTTLSKDVLQIKQMLQRMSGGTPTRSDSPGVGNA